MKSKIVGLLIAITAIFIIAYPLIRNSTDRTSNNDKKTNTKNPDQETTSTMPPRMSNGSEEGANRFIQSENLTEYILQNGYPRKRSKLLKDVDHFGKQALLRVNDIIELANDERLHPEDRCTVLVDLFSPIFGDSLHPGLARGEAIVAASVSELGDKELVDIIFNDEALSTSYVRYICTLRELLVHKDFGDWDYAALVTMSLIKAVIIWKPQLSEKPEEIWTILMNREITIPNEEFDLLYKILRNNLPTSGKEAQNGF